MNTATHLAITAATSHTAPARDCKSIDNQTYCLEPAPPQTPEISTDGLGFVMALPIVIVGLAVVCVVLGLSKRK